MATRPTLLTVLHDRIVAKHYSARTEEAYRHWVRRFVRHFRMRHPRDLGPADVHAFLTHLARDARVSASTQNHALAALLFMYREVIAAPNVGVDREHACQASAPTAECPVACRRRPCDGKMDGVPRLMASLLFGSALRLLECCHLRVKDLDFARRELRVRGSKGQKDRVTMQPAGLLPPLRTRLNAMRLRHEADLAAAAGAGGYLARCERN